MKKASELLEESAGPFDAACLMVRAMEHKMEMLREENAGLGTCHGCRYYLTCSNEMHCARVPDNPGAEKEKIRKGLIAQCRDWAPNYEGGKTLNREIDPNGKSAQEPGAKLDAGKNRLGLVLFGFSRALQAVGQVGTYGANKYTDNGWMDGSAGRR